MKAIILSAGRGTRLQPLTNTTPKSLLQVKNKPILEHILNNLPADISEVFIVVDYLSDHIKSFVDIAQDNYSFTIKCINQIKDKKGTMAALLSVRDSLIDNERFLVLNGDDIIEKKDIEKMLPYERSFGVQKMIMPNYYKVVSKNGFLNTFENQNETEKKVGVPIATGTYLIDTNIFNFTNRLLKGDEIGIPQTIIDNKDVYPINVVEFHSWKPINTIEDLEKVNHVD
jgi:NDP-sugar pyrophosphorylase family protein